MVTAQTHRSRSQNRAEAFQKMADILAAHFNPRESKRGIDSPPVRSYKLEDGLVVDHASGLKSNIRTLDDLDLSEMIQHRKIAIIDGDNENEDQISDVQ